MRWKILEPQWNRRQAAWGAFLLAAFALGLYAQAPAGGFINMDDGDYVLNNPLIRRFDGSALWAMFSQFHFYLYIPLVWLSYAVDYWFWARCLQIDALDPFGYHLQNIFWHAATVPLIFFLVRRLGRNAAAAWLAACLFAAHPVHVESVAWVTERKDVLFGFFFFASLLAYARYAQEGWFRWYWLSWGLFVASCLSKITGVVLPIALVLTDVVMGRELSGRRAWREKIPFFAFSLMLGGLSSAVLRGQVRVDFGLARRVALAGEGLLLYAAKSFWPLHLSYHYPIPNTTMELPWGEITLAVLATVLLAMWLCRKGYGRIGFFCGGIFVLNLLPVLQLLPVATHLAADRYLYVSSLGVCWAAALAVWMAGRGRRVKRVGAAIIMAMMVLGLSAATWRRVEVWRDSLILWNDAVKKYPSSDWANFHWACAVTESDRAKAEEAWKTVAAASREYVDAHVQLAGLWMAQGRVEQADKELELAEQSHFFYRQAYFLVRGAREEKTGKFEDALESYRKAIQLAPYHFSNREEAARVLTSLHRPQEAAEEYRIVLTHQPNNAKAWSKLGAAYRQMDKKPEAVEAFRQALRYEPTQAIARQHLAEMWIEEKRDRDAEALLRQGLALSPSEGNLHFALGTILLRNGLLNDAIPELQRATVFSRRETAAYVNLGVAYTLKGDWNRAESTYKRALTFAPDHAGLWANLATLYDNQDRKAEAVDAWQKAATQDPKNTQYQKQLAAAQQAARGQSPPPAAK